jgi:hypothetical protein
MSRIRSTRQLQRLLLAALAVPTVAVVGSSSVASAAPPSNDSFDNATAVTAMPFVDSVDITEATMEPAEPEICGASHTVWYTFTPASDVVISGTSAGSTSLNIYRADGAGLGGLAWQGCGSFGHAVTVRVTAGATYYVQAGSWFGSGGFLDLTLDTVPPPPNDDFTAATSISSVPFTDSQDITGATTEASEPVSSCGLTLAGTTWYAFTPATGGSYSAAINAGFGDVGVYTGSELDGLTRVACGAFGGLSTWQADAGTTYYIQAGTTQQQGLLGISVDVAPLPSVGFFSSPHDPSTFDNVQFSDLSFDSGNVGIESRTWDFGDGATGDGPSPTHRYATDGDYTVTLTATTVDGRSNTATSIVQVRTHDVGIVRITAPDSARVGKTVQVVAKLTNTRYPETVQVELLRSGPTGFEQVATSTQGVPVLRRGNTINFKFNYTITPADLTVGKVTFKAVAHVVGARDALPGDNEAIAPATKIKP